MTPVDLSLLFALAAIWGASFMFIKVAVREMSPIMLVSLRLVLAAATLLALQRAVGALRASTPASPPIREKWRAYAYMGLMNAIVPYTLIAWGEKAIPSGTASILNATTPLFTAVLAVLLARGVESERLTRLRALGLLVGFAGVAVLIVGSGQEVDVGVRGQQLLGYLAVLGGAAAYGVSGLYGRRAFAGVAPILPATWQNVCGAVMLLPFAWGLTPLTRLPSWQATGSALALGVMGTGVALVLYYQLLARVGATRTVMVTYLLPVMALIYGAVFLHEPVSVLAVLGLALVLAGVMLTVRARLSGKH
ncbi:MAG: DMT family transporter [Chloroflexota bacterium]|nr:DMT family transporter [Chloroflexota bacterium]